MRRAAFGAIVLALLVAPAAVCAGVPARLTIEGTDPLQIRGHRFAPSERVRVVLSLPVRRSRTVVASLSGTFTIRFRDVDLARCALLAVRATGSRGSIAILKIAPTCLPPADDRRR
jgi:hypothetical protein